MTLFTSGGCDAASESDASMSEPSEEAICAEEENASDAKRQRLDSLFDESCEMQVEDRFGTEFWVTSLSESLLESWEAGHTSAQLHLPPPNRFIATDFQLLQECFDEDDLPHLPASKVANFPVVQRLLPTPRQLTSEKPGLGQGVVKRLLLNACCLISVSSVSTQRKC